jgi:prepilin-type N-terminal cleavage/methylation domain-containing protein
MIKKQSGFTMIEILVSLGILVLLFGVVITSTTALGRRQRDQQRVTDLQNIQAALAQYKADQQYYPDTSSFNLSSATNLQNSSGNSYLQSIPHDPGSNVYCYLGQASSGGGACSNAGPTQCEYYHLYAMLENHPAGTGSCGSVTTYNFSLTPEQSN